MDCNCKSASKDYVEKLPADLRDRYYFNIVERHDYVRTKQLGAVCKCCERQCRFAVYDYPPYSQGINGCYALLFDANLAGPDKRDSDYQDFIAKLREHITSKMEKNTWLYEEHTNDSE